LRHSVVLNSMLTTMHQRLQRCIPNQPLRWQCASFLDRL